MNPYEWNCPKCGSLSIESYCQICNTPKPLAAKLVDAQHEPTIADTIAQLKLQSEEAWAIYQRKLDEAAEAGHHWTECNERWTAAVMKEQSV